MRGSVITLGTLALIAGCGTNPESDQDPSAPAPLPLRFVAFREPTLLIEKLEVPVDAPVTLGSSPAPDTLRSSAPDIVSVAPDGRLVGIRAGKGTIRAPSGDVLEVEVLAPRSIKVVPTHSQLAPGEHVNLSLRDESGARLPVRSAHWVTSDPEVAIIRDGAVQAGAKAGTARVQASLGGATAEAWIEVRVAGGPDRQVRGASDPGRGSLSTAR